MSYDDNISLACKISILSTKDLFNTRVTLHNIYITNQIKFMAVHNNAQWKVNLIFFKDPQGNIFFFVRNRSLPDTIR